MKVTQPIIGPLRRVIPAMGPIDSASLLVAYILSFIKAIVLFKVVTFMASTDLNTGKTLDNPKPISAADMWAVLASWWAGRSFCS